MTTNSALIGVTAIAIALTSFDLRPAAAAPESGPAIAGAEFEYPEMNRTRNSGFSDTHR